MGGSVLSEWSAAIAATPNPNFHSPDADVDNRFLCNGTFQHATEVVRSFSKEISFKAALVADLPRLIASSDPVHGSSSSTRTSSSIPPLKTRDLLMSYCACWVTEPYVDQERVDRLQLLFAGS